MDSFYRQVNGVVNFAIKGDFHNENLNLTVYQNSTAWTNQIPKKELVLKARNQDVSFEKFWDKLKQYLMSPLEGVEVGLDVSGKLVIKIQLQNGMKSEYFNCILKKTDFSPSIYKTLEEFYDSKVQSFKDFITTKNQYTALLSEHKCLEKKMEEFLARRENEERDVYNKFINILNEKKRHIQHLNELLVAFRQGRPMVNTPAPKKHKVTVEEPVYSPQSSEDERASEVNVRELSPVPGTSRQTQELLFTFLPKRICVSEKEECFFGGDTKEVEKPNTSETFVESEKEREELVVNFSTQELLDNF